MYSRKIATLIFTTFLKGAHNSAKILDFIIKAK